MIVTARQLEDLHRQSGSNGRLTLPYRARLTPLANDWIRARKIVLGYSDVESVSGGAPAQASSPKPVESAAPAPAAGSGGPILWWCDGPCGPAKAAVISLEKESTLRPLDKPADARQIVAVVKAVAAEIKSGRSHGAVLLVQNAALAALYANRCPSLRAILGTCMEAVEQGVRLAAANVLIVEYPYKTLPQVRNLLSRFVRNRPELSEEVRRELQELASCG